MISPSRAACIAALAAILASIGDFLLLYIGNARRPELGLPPIGAGWLWVGGILGVAAIPFYALGYRAAASLMETAAPRAAPAIFLNGISVGLLGALIHGATAMSIGLHNNAAGEDPLNAILKSGLLLFLWGVATLQVFFISAVFGWYVGLGRTAAPSLLALANPALLTILLAGVGFSSLFLRSFLTPAAPNIAHVIFFLLCAVCLRPLSREDVSHENPHL